MVVTRRMGPLVFLCALFATGCPQEDQPAAATSRQQRPAPTASARETATRPAAIGGLAAWPLERWTQWVNELSEPDGPFLSDNYISNETSFLQPSKALAARPSGGVYLGVGPEQNFSYIALAQPELAFIVDLRRDNLLLHLLYKACFEQAEDRLQFMELLFARAPSSADPRRHRAALEELFDSVATAPPSQSAFDGRHQGLQERIAGYGLDLNAKDRRRLRQIHRTFANQALALRFRLKAGSFRRYPTLRRLWLQRSPDGKEGSFLARRDTFLHLRQLQRLNRIVPLVGNFAGDRTLRGLATKLRSRKLTLSTFYVSNVEQYLLAGGLWPRWRRNLKALPWAPEATFIRAYLDQGEEHPQQLPGHRTTTVLQPVQQVLLRKRPYRSALELSTE